MVKTTLVGRFHGIFALTFSEANTPALKTATQQ
jgi:hypothetical protein